MKVSEQRKERIKEVIRTIHEENATGLQIVEKRLVAILAIRMGMSKRVIKEYIGLLIDSEQIISEKGIISLNERKK